MARFMQTEATIVSRTYFWDRVRATAQGTLETGYLGLALIIAITVFDAPTSVKGLISAANPMGHMLTPLTLGLFAWIKRPVGKIVSFLFVASGVCLALAGWAPGLSGFLTLLIAACVLGAQATPAMAHIYATNYPVEKRGSYLSTSFMFSVSAMLGFSMLFGKWLDWHAENYRWILTCLAGAAFLFAFAAWNIPSTPLDRASTQNPLRSLGYAFSDKRFGTMLLSWVFAGFGNLMVVPLRIEYLIQPEYQVQASTFLVAWITLGLPATCRFVSSKFWGKLFDVLDFAVMIVMLNVMQMISIFWFFNSKDLWMLGLASALNGIAMGGRVITWSLWVTKFATRERTAAYMSVHTFLTGMRGIVAPFVGFYLLAKYGAVITGGIGSLLLLISSLFALALILYFRQKRKRDQR